MTIPPLVEVPELEQGNCAGCACDYDDARVDPNSLEYDHRRAMCQQHRNCGGHIYILDTPEAKAEYMAMRLGG
jgi:hypothetical protein